MEHLQRKYDIARHRWQVGDTHGAIDELRALLAEDPEHAEAHALLGGCLLDQRRIHAALNEVEIAVSISPESFVARYLHAQVLIAHRRFGEAKDALEALLSEYPEAPELYRAMSDMVSLRGEPGSEDRRTLLAKALELDPQSPATLADCAHFHLARGEVDDAIQMARRALEQSPDHTQALWIMGEALLSRGDTDDARRHAAWVLARNAEHRGALTLLAKIRARRSPWLGAWWRFVSWVSLGGEARAIIILLAMYVVFRVSSLSLELAEYATLHMVLNVAWLGFVVYCLIAPVAFRRALQSELAEVTLRKDF